MFIDHDLRGNFVRNGTEDEEHQTVDEEHPSLFVHSEEAGDILIWQENEILGLIQQ